MTKPTAGQQSSEPSTQYFAATPAVASERSTVQLTLPDMSLALSTDRGVFSASRVDPGTKLLLLEAAVAPVGATTLLDLGCGYGPVALALATRHPEATVWATDTNERALELTRDNAEALGLSNVRVAVPEEVDAHVQFDLICSNPAIRIGKTSLRSMLEQWLKRLAPNGSAELVVQKHLGSDSLAAWLAGAGWPTTRLLSRNAYRVLRVDPQHTATEGDGP